jgi:hypothetical protein
MKEPAHAIGPPHLGNLIGEWVLGWTAEVRTNRKKTSGTRDSTPKTPDYLLGAPF